MSVVAGTFHPLCPTCFQSGKICFNKFLIGSLAIRTKVSVAINQLTTAALALRLFRQLAAGGPTALPMVEMHHAANSHLKLERMDKLLLTLRIHGTGIFAVTFTIKINHSCR